MGVNENANASNREAARSDIIGSKSKFAKKTVEYKGKQYDIRQPSLRARRKVMRQCSDSTGAIDMMAAIVWMAIYNTYLAGTDELVFDEGDFDALMEEPTGGFIDEISILASEMMNVTAVTDGKKN